jgi:hypothetical protein|tara:strand:+ start:1660 stop:2163 length:504 start_codon:yes stop_codon:yes gene_type:complete
MSVGDVARGAVSLEPTVLFTADADADAVYAIHHDIKGSVGGKLEYTALADEKWYYAAATNVTTNANLLSTSATYTEDSENPATGDLVRIISVTHNGVTSADVATSVNVHLSLDGAAPVTKVDAIVIGKDQSVIFKTYGVTLDNLHACTADGTSVSVKVVAILDDISA